MARLAFSGTPITHRDRLPSSSRYELLVKIASGGMATVYVGRLSSVVGTSRLVAIKRAHAHLLEDPMFGKMLIAEAKLASRIHHPNVVAVQNVEEVDGELLLVMDYVEGASLADLASDDEVPIPGRVAVRALLDACAGLHAAHELTDDDGKPLGIVHRDVSPHNILVGVDGVCRITDFGIAKSSGHTGSAGRTSTGALKGKVSYMAPEYIEHGQIDARSDVFSLGIVAWEALTRQRLFRGATEIESLKLVLTGDVPNPSEIAPWLGRALDKVILKALARDPALRFASASELGEALEQAARRDDLIATASQVGKHVRAAAGEALSSRRVLLRERPSLPDVEAASPPPVVPRGREDNTSSLRPVLPAEDGSVVRARSSVTSPMTGPQMILGPGGTLPLGQKAPAISIPPDDASTGGDVGQDSVGSGVSAHLVDEVGVLRRTSARRSPVLLWSASAVAGLALLAVGAALTLHRGSSAPAPSAPVTIAPAPPSATSTTTLSPLDLAIIAPTGASAASAAVSSASPARVAAPAAAGAIKTAKPGRAAIAPPSHPAPPPPISDPTPPPPPDRAPPNPYAK